MCDLVLFKLMIVAIWLGRKQTRALIEAKNNYNFPCCSFECLVIIKPLKIVKFNFLVYKYPSKNLENLRKMCSSQWGQQK